MRTVIALGLALVAATAAPALAQDAPMAPHSEQHDCLTWLSLAARFGPEGQQDAIEQQYLRLHGVVTARTDLSEDTKLTEANSAIDTYNKWVLDHFSANDETKATMIAELAARAADCAALVPPDPAEAITPAG